MHNNPVHIFVIIKKDASVEIYSLPTTFKIFFSEEWKGMRKCFLLHKKCSAIFSVC